MWNLFICTITCLFKNKNYSLQSPWYNNNLMPRADLFRFHLLEFGFVLLIYIADI